VICKRRIGAHRIFPVVSGISWGDNNIGQDNPFASQVRNSSGGQQNYFNPWLARNQTWLGNVIFHPRSDLLLSLEYRHLTPSPSPMRPITST
jgi:hypothetical protein